MRKLLVILLLLSFGVSFAAEQHAPGGPIIVAKRSFIDQTGDMATTTIVKVRRDGLYRISLYETETSGGYLQPVFNLIWTDESGVKQAGEANLSPFPSIVLNTPGQVNGGQIVVHCLAGTKIQVNGVVSADGQPTYNVFVIVEML